MQTQSETGQTWLEVTRRVRERRPGALVLTIVNGYYHAIEEDAIVVARTCGLPAYRWRDGTPVVGFRVDGAERHIGRLIDAGREVLLVLLR